MAVSINSDTFKSHDFQNKPASVRVSGCSCPANLNKRFGLENEKVWKRLISKPCLGSNTFLSFTNFRNQIFALGLPGDVVVVPVRTYVGETDTFMCHNFLLSISVHEERFRSIITILNLLWPIENIRIFFFKYFRFNCQNVYARNALA